MFFRIAVAACIAYLTIAFTRLARDRPPPAPVPAPPAAAGSSPRSSTRVVDVRRADLERMNEIASSARIVPALRDGAAVGVKLYAIRPDSPLAVIGLENGDTVRAINDVRVTSPDAALEVYRPLAPPDHLDLDVERRGERLRLLVLLH